MQTGRPNIIYIVADDMGYGDGSCSGSETIKTPGIDALAADGARFTDFHANGPVCSPTRAALLTGRYQQRSGIEGVITAAKHRDTGLALNAVTFADVFRDAGYRTALFGKWHLGYPERYNPTHRGFETFRGFVSGNIDYFSHIDQAGHEDWWQNAELRNEDGYTTDLVTAHGLRFIREHAGEPFCLYLAHECPHYPYQGPWDSGYREPGQAKPISGPREDKDAAYIEMMEHMDAGIARIRETVDELGIAANTLIVFFSDNGPAALGSAGPFRGGKGQLYEGGHRVPAAAYWPGQIPAGSNIDFCCMSMDLFPTMCAAAGIETPANLDGRDLMPVLRGEADPAPPRTLFWRFKGAKAVREGSLKLVEIDGSAELFDLSSDPGETTDISATNPNAVARMRDALAAWEADVKAPCFA